MRPSSLLHLTEKLQQSGEVLDGADHLRNVGVLVVVPGDDLNLGDMTWVKFMGFDEKGRANFSRKDALKEIANQ